MTAIATYELTPDALKEILDDRKCPVCRVDEKTLERSSLGSKDEIYEGLRCQSCGLTLSFNEIRFLKRAFKVKEEIEERIQDLLSPSMPVELEGIDPK